MLSNKRLVVTCQNVMALLRRGMGRTGFSDDFISTAVKGERTVFFRKTLRSEEGLEYSLYEKTHGLWGTNARSNGYDPQGDPRWFLEVVGLDVAHVWGFHWSGDRLIQLPSHRAWAFHLERVSARLVRSGFEPIPIGFHPSLHLNEKGKVVLEKYYSYFIDKSQVPLAEKDIPFLHDMSYHTGAVLIPGNYLKTFRARAQYFATVIARMKALEAESQSPERAKTYRAILKRLNKSLVGMIDAGTGVLNPLVADTQVRGKDGKPIGDERRLVKEVMPYLLGVTGVAPLAEMRSWINTAYKKVENVPLGSLPLRDLHHVLSEIENDFVSGFEGFDIREPNWVQPEEFCLALSQRRQELREASLSLVDEVPRTPFEQQLEAEAALEYEAATPHVLPANRFTDWLARVRDFLNLRS